MSSSTNSSIFEKFFSNTSSNTSRIRSGQCFADGVVYRAVAYVLIFVVSLIGNSMIVVVNIKGKFMRKNAHLFLFNMAIADLVVTVVYMPRMIVKSIVGIAWLVEGGFGLVLCRVVPFLHHLAILVSVFTILGATFDRFCAIMFPLRNIMTRTVARIIVVVIWFVSAGLRSPYLVTPVLKHRKSYSICRTNMKGLFGEHFRVYERTLLSIYCLSLLTTIVLYSILIVKLKRDKPTGASYNAAQARKAQASRKLLHMLLVITLCFILCWFLYFFAFDIFSRPIGCKRNFLRFVLAHSNSALNPVILCIFNTQYRNSFKRIMNNFLRCWLWKSFMTGSSGDNSTDTQNNQLTNLNEKDVNIEGQVIALVVTRNGSGQHNTVHLEISNMQQMLSNPSSKTEL